MMAVSAVLVATLGLASAGNVAYRMLNVPDAPFAMPPVRECVFPARDFLITDFGARPDGSVSTLAFAAAMKACSEAGGGRVSVPKGRWLTGVVRLLSNCCLYLQEGATLEFTDDPKDYPVVETAWEGVECLNISPLIHASGVENVGIAGPGRIEPRMRLWRDWFARPPEHNLATELLYHWGSTNAPMSVRNVAAIRGANVRPPLIEFNRVKNVLLDGFSVRESPFWTIHLYHSEDCVVRNLDLRAHGHNNDGIDVDMTRNVLIEKCRFDQGDDGVCLKAGRNQDAWRLNRPTENVVVRDCEFLHAQSMLGIGSELSGGIRNIWMTRCRSRAGLMGMRIKTNRRRGGFVENIWFDHCTLGSVHWMFGLQMDVLYQWAAFPDYEIRYTKIANVNVSDVTCRWAEIGIGLYGDYHLKPTGMSFANIRFDTVMKALTDIRECGDVRLAEVSCVNGQGDSVQPESDVLPVRGRWADLSKGHECAAAFANRHDLAGMKDGTYELGEGVVARIGTDIMRPVSEATYWTDDRFDTLVILPDADSRERFWIGPDKMQFGCSTGGYVFIPSGMSCADRLVYANRKPCRRIVVKIPRCVGGR